MSKSLEWWMKNIDNPAIYDFILFEIGLELTMMNYCNSDNTISWRYELLLVNKKIILVFSNWLRYQTDKVFDGVVLLSIE